MGGSQPNEIFSRFKACNIRVGVEDEQYKVSSLLLLLLNELVGFSFIPTLNNRLQVSMVVNFYRIVFF